MIITNTEKIHGRQITENLGIVTGNIVQSKHVGRDIMANLKTIVGGEIAGYTEMLMEAREKAQKRMTKEAQSRGADAVVNVRYATSAISQGMCELLTYGTAVKLD